MHSGWHDLCYCVQLFCGAYNTNLPKPFGAQSRNDEGLDYGPITHKMYRRICINVYTMKLAAILDGNAKLAATVERLGNSSCKLIPCVVSQPSQLALVHDDLTGLDKIPGQFWLDMKSVMYNDPHDLKASLGLESCSYCVNPPRKFA